MNGIRFGIPNARRSRGLHVVDSHGPLTELALLRRYTDGLGWSIIRSSQVCKVYGTVVFTVELRIIDRIKSV